ncbi:NirD/YgiW/YdeI family stress tolerance protein [Pantoea sp. BIGb0393]|uniref:NirD/YgiW/YdeI family stress tolerance protein n=1 Tax=Pantoea nemavictus TaxID=2726955 RepID=A0ABU8PW93_9GAMM|nr:NirD/YgiW/YdeI family stress tolerance protein [Pantoea nemavictus]MBA0038050.1 NirD/YgiW/YdeI family stress tolerance protein [Pantoea nemavictus]
MKRIFLASTLLLLSLGAGAAEGGFKSGETAPPQNNQDAGYKGSEDTGQTPISRIRDFRQGGYVTLEGHIIEKLQGDDYRFRDDTGTITIQAEKSTFKEKTYSADDKVRVSGKVYGRGDQTTLKVSRIDEP